MTLLMCRKKEDVCFIGSFIEQTAERGVMMDRGDSPTMSQVCGMMCDRWAMKIRLLMGRRTD